MVKSGMSKLVSLFLHASGTSLNRSLQIYLVEEHDTKKAMETWGRQIWTMKSSLQMVEYVKHFMCPKHTFANFLNLVTLPCTLRGT